MDILNIVMDIRTVKSNRNLINSTIRVSGKIDKVFQLPTGNYYQISDHTDTIMVLSGLSFRINDMIEVIGRLQVGRNNQLYILSNNIVPKAGSPPVLQSASFPNTQQQQQPLAQILPKQSIIQRITGLFAAPIRNRKIRNTIVIISITVIIIVIA